MFIANEQDSGRGADDGAPALAAQRQDLLVGIEQLVFTLGQQIGRGRRSADRIERLHYDLARDIAGLVTAHAVGNRPQSHIGANQA